MNPVYNDDLSSEEPSKPNGANNNVTKGNQETSENDIHVETPAHAGDGKLESTNSTNANIASAEASFPGGKVVCQPASLFLLHNMALCLIV